MKTSNAFGIDLLDGGVYALRATGAHHDLRSFASELDGRRLAKALARRADDRVPAGNAKVHQPLTLSSTPRRASTSRYSATSYSGTAPSVAVSQSRISPTLRCPSTRINAS